MQYKIMGYMVDCMYQLCFNAFTINVRTVASIRYFFSVLSMLGFSGYVCAIRSATDTFGEGTGPVWLRNVRCRFYDANLDNCRHDGLNEDSCPHTEDAAVICQGYLYCVQC